MQHPPIPSRGSLLRRTMLAFAVAALGACGGGGSSGHLVGGTLSGMQTGDAVTLENNGDEALVLEANGAFRFEDAVRAYDVMVAAQPNWQDCSVANGSGTAGGEVSSVSVTCTRAGTVGTLATAAGFLTMLATDARDNIYAGELNGSLVRITPAGVATVVAGGMNMPIGVAVAADGSIYVANAGTHQVLKVTPGGTVTAFAGTGAQGGDDGLAAAATFDTPYGLAFDAAGNLYVVELGGHRVRKITAGGVVSTLAGSGVPGFADGAGTAASFDQPGAVAVDRAGNVYVADTANNRIRKITPAGVVSTLAGSGTAGSADGAGSAASFSTPLGIAVGPDGYVYVAELNGAKVRRISPAGVVNTLAGTGTAGIADGPVATASLTMPASVTLDSQGNLFVSEISTGKLRKITR